MKLLTQSNKIQDGKISKILHKLKSALKRNFKRFAQYFGDFTILFLFGWLRGFFYEYIFFINQLSGFSVILD